MRQRLRDRNASSVTPDRGYSLTMRTRLTLPRRALISCLVMGTAAGCVARPTVAPPVNTADLAIAPDAMADTLLVDVRSLDPTIVVSMRYATANNFTGAPL